MKVNKFELERVVKNSETYFEGIFNNLHNFKDYCNNIKEAYKQTDTHLYDTCESMSIALSKILNTAEILHSDYFTKFKNEVNDKFRASVLYPYENQAIYQYLNKFNFKKNCYRKFGCIYAEKVKIDNKEVVVIGLSICNDKDVFSKSIALNLAKKRAREYPTRYSIRVTPIDKVITSNTVLNVPLRGTYEYEITKFIKRCNRWFKNENILYPSNIEFTEFPIKKKKKSNKITDEPMPF